MKVLKSRFPKTCQISLRHVPIDARWPRGIKGIFLGLRLNPGCVWRGECIIAKLEDFMVSVDTKITEKVDEVAEKTALMQCVLLLAEKDPHKDFSKMSHNELAEEAIRMGIQFPGINHIEKLAHPWKVYMTKN